MVAGIRYEMYTNVDKSRLRWQDRLKYDPYLYYGVQAASIGSGVMGITKIALKAAKNGIRSGYQFAKGQASKLIRNLQNKSALRKFGKSIDDLASAAGETFNKEGLTKAGRAFTKHASGQRGSGTFPKLSGGIEAQNRTALDLVNDILKDPNSTFVNLPKGGLEVRALSGYGLRFNKGGSFSGFVD